ncbi:YtxH domain-containing protein [Paenibacillus sp. P96]|uniref:YtxH domain-containing protein n=1 Tax=Paenibacillus zeirhizosphaerae TaxID=2987519 RepID=A0ABT9FSQ2_9BACL|nr:YtxH domain-containing protein [Paenibacillus sp. P96]MDP4097769.1 YtxH domain-containing protein [Paenibacillus sp. P96]
MNEKSKIMMWSAIAGTILGSAAALLLTPKSGRELRKDLADCTQQFSEAGLSVADKIGTAGLQLVDIVKDTTSYAVQEVRQAYGKQEEEEKVIISAVDKEQSEDRKTSNEGYYI